MIKVVTLRPTITAGAYSASDAVGEVMTIERVARRVGEGAILQSVTIIDLGNVKAALHLHLFSEDLTTKAADNAAFDVADSELTKYLGEIAIGTSDYISIGTDFAVATISGLNLPLFTTRGRNLYAQLSADATPTYGATNGLIIQLGFDVPAVNLSL